MKFIIQVLFEKILLKIILLLHINLYLLGVQR
jgi:hypothetical protein